MRERLLASLLQHKAVKEGRKDSWSYGNYSEILSSEEC